MLVKNKKLFQNEKFSLSSLPKYTIISKIHCLISWKNYEERRKIALAYMYHRQTIGMNHTQSSPVSYLSLCNILQKLKKTRPEDIVNYHISNADFLKYMLANDYYVQQQGIGFISKLQVYISDIELDKTEYPNPYRIFCPTHRRYLFVDPLVTDSFRCIDYVNNDKAHSYTINELAAAILTNKIEICHNYKVEIHDVTQRKKISNVSLDSKICHVLPTRQVCTQFFNLLLFKMD